MKSAGVGEITATLERLVGTRLVSLGRAADSQWFSFTYATGSELALHVQCPWRIVSDDEMLIGHGDYWISAASDTSDAEYDNAVSGSRWRDIRRDMLMERIGSDGALVTGMDVDSFGGFSLHFENALRLVVFPDTTGAPHYEIEYWRIFEPVDGGEHFVVSSDGIHRNTTE